MKTVSRALALVLVASTCFAQDVARLEQVVQANVQNKTFMGAVLVARGAEIVLSTGYGSANLEWDAANTPATKFRIAHALLLQERGRATGVRTGRPREGSCRHAHAGTEYHPRAPEVEHA